MHEVGEVTHDTDWKPNGVTPTSSSFGPAASRARLGPQSGVGRLLAPEGGGLLQSALVCLHVVDRLADDVVYLVNDSLPFRGVCGLICGVEQYPDVRQHARYIVHARSRCQVLFQTCSTQAACLSGAPSERKLISSLSGTVGRSVQRA